MPNTNKNISWSDFSKVEMRIGAIISAVEFKEVKNPAYKLQIDFGEFGVKKTSAQITQLYKPTDLIGKQIMAVINFPPKQIANMMSECLLLGAMGDDNDVVILNPERKVNNGLKVG
jgi:tRNA-binding protein